MPSQSERQHLQEGHHMGSSTDIVESAARFLLAGGWRPDPQVSGSVRHEGRSKQVAVAVWRRMEFLLAPAAKAT